MLSRYMGSYLTYWNYRDEVLHPPFFFSINTFWELSLHSIHMGSVKLRC